MNIAVIAANGRTGQAFVQAAVKAGHQVRAGIHNYSTLKPLTGLTLVECDATIENDVTNLIKGQDAVVCFIGHVRGSQPNVQTNAIKVTVTTMTKLGQKRLVSLTGTGVRLPGDKITMIDRFLNLSIGIIDPERVADGINHSKVLMDSDLDWTIIRVLKLTNGKSRPYTLQHSGPTKAIVSRKEVALAVLEVIEQHSFIRQAPIICDAVGD